MLQLQGFVVLLLSKCLQLEDGHLATLLVGIPNAIFGTLSSLMDRVLSALHQASRLS